MGEICGGYFHRKEGMSMKKVVFVITGGQIGDPDFLRIKIAELDPVEIICADGGARHMHALGLIPGVIIGDMDSLSREITRYFEERGSRILRYPEKKDETDTQLALEYAFGMEPEKIYIFGAFGTRIDHVLANISLLISGEKKGIQVLLVDEWCEVFVVTGEHIIEGEEGQTVSLLPVSGMATGIRLDGFEYPLENGVMEMGVPYGISNRLIAPRGIVKVGAGQLLVIRYFKTGNLP